MLGPESGPKPRMHLVVPFRRSSLLPHFLPPTANALAVDCTVERDPGSDHDRARRGRNAPLTTARVEDGEASRAGNGSLAGGAPRQLVVLLHGVGADGQDLIGLAPMLAERLPHALFVAPDAPQPCDMAPYGRQWFSLQDRRPAAMLAGARADAPLLDAFLDELLRRHGLDESGSRCVGFSQGTMMSLSSGHGAPARRPRSWASRAPSWGRRTCRREAREPAAGDAGPRRRRRRRAGGRAVPAVAGLQAAEIPVQWIIRPGLPHSIDPYGIEAGGKFLKDMLGG